MAGEAVVGSYSYRDEVKQDLNLKQMANYFQAGLHTVSYIADRDGFRLL